MALSFHMKTYSSWVVNLISCKRCKNEEIRVLAGRTISSGRHHILHDRDCAGGSIRCDQRFDERVHQRGTQSVLGIQRLFRLSNPSISRPNLTHSPHTWLVTHATCIVHERIHARPSSALASAAGLALYRPKAHTMKMRWRLVFFWIYLLCRH